MGMLDKAADTFWMLASPKRAALRQHLRRMNRDGDYREVFLAMMRARGYRSAQANKGKTPWLGGGRSADSEILTDLPLLRNHSRELNRDDPIASGLTATFVNNVIGTGIRPQARTDEPEKNKSIEAMFAERRRDLAPAENITYGEQQRLTFRKVVEDGEVFVKRAKRTAIDPLWFEIVEADRVATPRGKKPSEATGEIRDGIEKDEHGIPVAYWIRKRHPGDNLTIGATDWNAFVRVDAENVNHLKSVSRPGQTRGVPRFHAIQQDLRDLDLLLLASLKRVQVAACVSAFFKSPESLETVLDVTAKKYGYQLDQALEPGMMWKLYPGEEVETLIPNFPTPELESFVIMLARRIGSALGVSWQIVLKDFSRANYSSARTDLLEARQGYVVLQTWFIESHLRWEWEQVLLDARMRGDERLDGVTDEDIQAVHWIPNGWRWVDPVKEASATKIMLEVGLTCLRDECAAQGKDWEELQDQRLREEQREQEKRKTLGLPEAATNAATVLSFPENDDSDERPAWARIGGAA